MSTGENIKRIRKFRGMTQKELGIAIGIGEESASPRMAQYETDNRNPKLEQLSKIAEALEVSVFEFLDIEINSVNDIISLVNKMNIATDID